MLHEFSGSGLLREVAGAARSSRLVLSELESFGNYASALLFVAVALSRRQHAYTGEPARRVRVAPAGLIRLLHIVLAGEIQVDGAYAQRALRFIDARRPSGENFEVHFPPLPPNLLDGVQGLDSPLEEAVVALDNQLTVLEIENLLLNLIGNLSGPYAASISSVRYTRFDYRYRHSTGPADYLQRIISLRVRSQYDESRFLERRVLDTVDRLQAGFAGALPPPLLEEMVMRIRELAHESGYRGMSSVEFLSRTERMLRQMIDPDRLPTRGSKTRSRSKGS